MTITITITITITNYENEIRCPKSDVRITAETQRVQRGLMLAKAQSRQGILLSME